MDPERSLHPAAAWIVRWEGWLVYLLGALAFAAIPLSLGYLGISWDAVNHHIYLGWVADKPRFDRDLVAAAWQSYQYPYLYWPFYKLAMTGVSGATAGMVLALVHSLAIPAAWLIARAMIPGRDLFTAGMRLAAVALAFMSGLLLSLFDSTSNDLMAAIPLVWSYALALRPLDGDRGSVMRAMGASGFLAGVSVAFKLSNGLLVLALPVLWLWPAGSLGERAWRCVVAGALVLAGFLVAYGYWGWELWSHFGNPIYPFVDGLFEPARRWLGWQP